jgi:hypothetical protein
MKCDSSEEYHTEESLGDGVDCSKHSKKKRGMQQATIISQDTTITTALKHNRDHRVQQQQQQQQQKQHTDPIPKASRSSRSHHHHSPENGRSSKNNSTRSRSSSPWAHRNSDNKNQEREYLRKRQQSQSPSKNRHLNSSKEQQQHHPQASKERCSKTATGSEQTRSVPTRKHQSEDPKDFPANHQSTTNHRHHPHSLPKATNTNLTRKESKRNISYPSSDDDESNVQKDNRKSRRPQYDSETNHKRTDNGEHSKPFSSQSEHQTKRESSTNKNDKPVERSRGERELRNNDHHHHHHPSSDGMKESRHSNRSKSTHGSKTKINDASKSKDIRHGSSEKKSDPSSRRGGGRTGETDPPPPSKTTIRDSGSIATATSSSEREKRKDPEKQRPTKQGNNTNDSTHNHKEKQEKTTEHRNDRWHRNEIGQASEHRSRRETARKQQDKPRKESEFSEHKNFRHSDRRKNDPKDKSELGPSEHKKKVREQHNDDIGSSVHGASSKRETDRKREDRSIRNEGESVDRSLKQNSTTGKEKSARRTAEKSNHQESTSSKIVHSKHITMDSHPKSQNGTKEKSQRSARVGDPKTSRQMPGTKRGETDKEQRDPHNKSPDASTSDAPSNHMAKQCDGNTLKDEENTEDHSESGQEDKNDINEQLLLQIKRLLAPPGEDNQDVEDILDALIHIEAPLGDVCSIEKSTEHSTKDRDLSSINMSVDDEDVVTSFNPLELDVDEELRTFSTPLGLDAHGEANLHGTDHSSWVTKKILVGDEDKDENDEDDDEDFDEEVNEDSTLESGEISCPSFIHRKQAQRMDDDLSVNTGVGRSTEPKPILPYDGALSNSDSFDYDGDESAACLKDYVDNSRNGETFDFGLVNNGRSLNLENASPSNHSRRKVTKANRVMQIGKFFHLNRRSNPIPSHHDEDVRSVSSSNSRLFGLIKRHAPLGDFDDDR